MELEKILKKIINDEKAEDVNISKQRLPINQNQ